MVVELRIVMEPGQPTKVSGPINNKILAYGMLEEARDIIREHNAKPATGIVEARTLPNGFPRN